tara:strand:- start:3368 stop:4042 length:675 start_codon:yes stop_codon:yes gene_type:complete
MEDLFDISNLQIVGTTVTEFIIGLLLTSILSILTKNIYLSFSNSVSNKSIIANIFPLFSVSIFLIVITIKSSIVLSLGLVGALSIIRFRTAIKEAEQIVYFLILTGISIAVAAGSYLTPFLLVLFIYCYNYYLSTKKNKSVYSINDQIVLTLDKIDNKSIEELIVTLNERNVNVEVQSIIKKDDQTVIVLKLSDFDLTKLSLVEEFLKTNKIKNKEIQFFSSSE